MTPERRGRLRVAREYVATSLFAEAREDCGPAVAPWKAWALVGWMVVTIGLYAASMAGLW